MPFVAPASLEAERVRVRLVRESDLPALFEVNSDEAVTALLPYATWATLADARAWLERMSGIQATGLALQFVVAGKADDRAIGTCLLFRLEEASRRAELGYALGRAHWGQGLMQEALQSLVGCAFGDLGLGRLEAQVEPRNLASIRLLGRLGFKKEGLLRQRWITKGAPTDIEMHGLLRNEWHRT